MLRIPVIIEFTKFTRGERRRKTVTTFLKKEREAEEQTKMVVEISIVKNLLKKKLKKYIYTK